MSWFSKTPMQQGRSHGCTVFGSLLAGIANGHNAAPSVPSRSPVRCVSFSLRKSGHRHAARQHGCRDGARWTLQPLILIAAIITWCAGERTPTASCCPVLLRPGSFPQRAAWQDLQRLLRGDAPSAHARLVGFLRCRAVSRLPPLGRPHHHGGWLPLGCVGSRMDVRARGVGTELGEVQRGQSAPSLWVIALVSLTTGVLWSWRLGTSKRASSLPDRSVGDAPPAVLLACSWSATRVTWLRLVRSVAEAASRF